MVLLCPCCTTITISVLGIGICFRDSHGSLVQAHTMVFPFEVITTECEASALKHVLLIATTNGFERVIFESDCLMTFNAITTHYRYKNELGTLLSTCKSIFSPNVNYNITFVRRQANRVADNLTIASVLQSSPKTFYYPPSCISFWVPLTCAPRAHDKVYLIR
jgi:hypothetical protein